MTRHSWREGFKPFADVPLDEFVKAVERSRGDDGRFHPVAVVDEIAADPDHPCRSLMPETVDEAAREFWTQRIRHHVINVEIVSPKNKRTAYVVTIGGSKQGGTYGFDDLTSDAYRYSKRVRFFENQLKDLMTRFREIPDYNDRWAPWFEETRRMIDRDDEEKEAAD